MHIPAAVAARRGTEAFSSLYLMPISLYVSPASCMLNTRKYFFQSPVFHRFSLIMQVSLAGYLPQNQICDNLCQSVDQCFNACHLWMPGVFIAVSVPLSCCLLDASTASRFAKSFAFMMQTWPGCGEIIFICRAKSTTLLFFRL